MQVQKTKMSQKKFRIGELAEELKVKKFVIRFWEKEFDFASDRSQGGQRFYTSQDLNLFLTIKDLLYNQGYTIAGAKAQLSKTLKEKAELTAGSDVEIQEQSETITPAHHEVLHSDAMPLTQAQLPEHVREQIVAIKEKLNKLKKLLD